MTHSLLKSLVVILTNQDFDAKILSKIQTKIQEVYNPDTLPITLPIWVNQPDDLPIMIFNSPNWESLQIKKRRLEFTSQYNPQNDIETTQVNIDKITKITDILKLESIPFTKCWAVIDTLKKTENPNDVMNKLDIIPFKKDEKEDSQNLSFSIAKITRKSFETYWNLLYRLYLDTWIKDASTQEKYYLFGIDMNNFDEWENISTTEKVRSFIKLVENELKNNLIIIGKNG